MPSKLTTPVDRHDHLQGSLDARVTLLEYDDFQCPYCGAAYPPIKQGQDHFQDEVCFVFRHFLLVEVHPLAESAAKRLNGPATTVGFGRCTTSYKNQESPSTVLLVELAGELALDPEDLVDALKSRKFHKRVEHDMRRGIESGIQGTPSFFINGEMYV